MHTDFRLAPNHATVMLGLPAATSLQQDFLIDNVRLACCFRPSSSLALLKPQVTRCHAATRQHGGGRVFFVGCSACRLLHTAASSAQIEVRGVDGELKAVAEGTLSLKPNFAYTLKEVKDDVQQVFDSGYFDRCQPKAEDTRDGVKLIIEVPIEMIHLPRGYQDWSGCNVRATIEA